MLSFDFFFKFCKQIGEQVTSPLLKLFAELVQNRSQRLQFDSTSPNGVLLFREASKVLCSYGKKNYFIFL